jgi:hypothetical protein
MLISLFSMSVVMANTCPTLEFRDSFTAQEVSTLTMSFVQEPVSSGLATLILADRESLNELDAIIIVGLGDIGETPAVLAVSHCPNPTLVDMRGVINAVGVSCSQCPDRAPSMIMLDGNMVTISHTGDQRQIIP